jgi:hypothetical protein
LNINKNITIRGSCQKKILLAIALGYADPQSPINQFKTGREDLDAYLRWYE